MPFFLFLFCALGFFLSVPSQAQVAADTPMLQPLPGWKLDIVPANQTIDTIPPKTATLDGELPSGQFPILRLTPDKIDVLRLEKDAVNVIVGNAAHLMAVIETPRQVLLVPRAPGATHFQVLDAKGNTIMERAVIVASPRQDYIRVRRACATKDSGECLEYSVFYCPDMCHSINVTQKPVTGSGAGANVPNETASGDTSTASNEETEMIEGQPVPASAPSNTAQTMGNALMVP